MVTDFQERLRQIREERDRESRAKRDVEAALNLERLNALEQRFDRREQIERTIEGFASKFISEVPTFERTKSFFEGKYQIEVSTDDLLVDEHGSPQKLFSRIAFLIDTLVDAGQLTVVCKKTVRNRDQDPGSARVGISSTNIDEFARFAEQQFFEFADAYFSGAASSR